jgi:hypothetical protein
MSPLEIVVKCSKTLLQYNAKILFVCLLVVVVYTRTLLLAQTA